MPGWVCIGHWVSCGGDRRSSNGLTVCWLQMWMNAGTGPSAGPMPFARICLAPSSASVTRATRGHGTGVTAWVRGSRGWVGPEGGEEVGQAQPPSIDLNYVNFGGMEFRPWNIRSIFRKPSLFRFYVGDAQKKKSCINYVKCTNLKCT